MKTLYLECLSGISGDMTVAALLDLGADEQVLREGLASLQVDGYTLEISRVDKSGITACNFDVKLADEALHIHDHNHGHSHALENGHEHSHTHDDDHEHSLAHDHGHEHNHTHDHGHEHEHVHRNFSDICAIIEASAISPRAKQLAVRMFEIVAAAEAKVHGKPVDEVHFHEVGAVDSIVDIVGAAICIDNLQIDKVICTPLREGTGTVRCQHGIMPVPAPATLEIIRAHNIPLQITQNKGEMVTPTGAAIVAALAPRFGTPQESYILATGYGAGKKSFAPLANVLRASLLQETHAEAGTVVKLECNLDDMTGEALAFACEKLFSAGALDVWCTPIIMKKGRPAQMLSVLAEPALEKDLARVLFKHTSTIGVRVSLHNRHTMHRQSAQVCTPYGKVVTKELFYDEICKTGIEYESAKQLAQSAGVSVDKVFRAAYKQLEK